MNLNTALLSHMKPILSEVIHQSFVQFPILLADVMDFCFGLKELLHDAPHTLNFPRGALQMQTMTKAPPLLHHAPA
jgi:hypothetical protein